jgi:2-methylcitrate dehydratase
MVAVVLLDGELNPAQYAPERIVADDVQELMRKVTIEPDDEFSARFPDAMPADLTVTLADGTELRSEKDSYEGFHTNPLTWEKARTKFDALTSPFASQELRDEIADVVHKLDELQVSELTALLANVRRERA